jgi:hypothetical protein
MQAPLTKLYLFNDQPALQKEIQIVRSYEDVIWPNNN